MHLRLLLSCTFSLLMVLAQDVLGKDGDEILWPDADAFAEAEELRGKHPEEEITRGIAISDSQIVLVRLGISSKGNGTLILPGLTVRVYDRHRDNVEFRGGFLLCQWRREPGQTYFDLVVSGIAEHFDEKGASITPAVPVHAVFRYSASDHRFFPTACSPDIDFWSSDL